MEECKDAIEHLNADNEYHNHETKKEKEKYKKNDCKAINNAFKSALDAIKKIIDAIVDFLLSFVCKILDMAFLVAGAALDGLLMAIPGMASIIISMKLKWYCDNGANKAEKPNPKPGAAESMQKAVLGLVTPPPPPARMTPVAFVAKVYKLWIQVVVLIDNDDLTNKAGPGSDFSKVMFWLLIIWKAICGQFMTALVEIAKAILYCNVDLGCPCPNTDLIF